MKKNIILVLMIVIIVSCAILILNKKPEGTTELYFKGSIPDSLESNKSYNISFAVHNLEYNPILYNYEVKMIRIDESKTIAKNSFILDHEDARATDIDILVEEEYPKKTMVLVILDYLNKTQQIYFSV